MEKYKFLDLEDKLVEKEWDIDLKPYLKRFERDEMDFLTDF